METGMTSQQMSDQNVYVPTTANPYQHSFVEVGSHMGWYNNPSSTGYYGQDYYLPTEYYAVPDNGSMHPSYNTNSTCQTAPSLYPPSYITMVFPYAQNSASGSTATLLHPHYVPYHSSMPGYAATSANGTLPLIAPVTTRNDIVGNPPVQSTIVSSKQFEDHTNLEVQPHHSVPQGQEQPDGSMSPDKLPSASQASTHSPDLQKWASTEKFHPSSKSNVLSAKSYTSRLPDSNPDGTTIHIKTDEYNGHDLLVDYTDAKFFVIKSIGEPDVHKSIKYGVWSSSKSGNLKLNDAFRYADRISKENNTKCPVFLFFSVNGSGCFCGMAEMVGPVDFERDMDFWCSDKWRGFFPVRWHIVKDIPNYSLQHITLQNNEKKPVTHSRDTQEIFYKPGITLLKTFKDAKLKGCLFDAFMEYEEDERIDQSRRCKLSHNAPDFVPVSQRREDASDAQQAKVSNVLMDRTSEIHNVSEKPHARNVMKHQDPCVEPVEKQASEAGKENGQLVNPCNGKQSQQDAAKTTRAPTSTSRTDADGKQEWRVRVENRQLLAENTAQGSSRAPEKCQKGVCTPASVVSETSEEQNVIAKVASLEISSKAGEADCKSCPVGVITIGSVPVRVSEV